MRRRWRWLLAAVLVAAAAWPAKPARACGGIRPFAINCDGIIIANQVVQIGHMVTQIAELVEQVARMQSIDEILTTDLPGVGNMGRLREVMDERWGLNRDGSGLSTVGGVAGVFNQRIPGVTDGAGWLDVLAAPRLGDPAAATVLLGGRPATETSPLEDGAFRTWVVPVNGAWSRPASDGAIAALGDLTDVSEGAASLRDGWDDIETTLPAAVTEADLRDLTTDVAAQDRMVEDWRRSEELAGTELYYTHAAAEAASTLAVQLGETAAHLAALRDDDLMRTQRVDQAVLAAAMTQTELLLAQAQVTAYEQARAARERYEAERGRRERLAEWRTQMADGGAAWEAQRTAIVSQQAARIAAHRAVPDPSAW